MPAESVRIDPREGGAYEYLMIDPTGGEWPTAGIYLEVREPERLRFTWGGRMTRAVPMCPSSQSTSLRPPAGAPR